MNARMHGRNSLAGCVRHGALSSLHPSPLETRLAETRRLSGRPVRVREKAFHRNSETKKKGKERMHPSLSPIKHRPDRSRRPGAGRPRAKHHPPVLGVCLSLHWMQPSLLLSVSLFFLLVRVVLKLRSLCIHPPRLCRIAVFQYKPTLAQEAERM